MGNIGANQEKRKGRGNGKKEEKIALRRERKGMVVKEIRKQ